MFNRPSGWRGIRKRITVECTNLDIHHVCEAGISNLDNGEEPLRNFLGYGGEYWNRLEKWQTR